MNYRRSVILLILAATIVRMAVALFTNLGNDEVYYRLYAEPLQWNYFDHPPMVGWLIRLSTFNLFADHTFTIRLGAIICSAVTTWLLFRCGEILLSEYAGFLAAMLYTASIYGSIIAGTFILPDSPQMVCWVASLLLLIKITDSKIITRKTIKDILWLGVLTGLGMLCKIHTVFLWFGFGLYLLFYKRDWLSHWSIYVAAIITLLFFAPVIWWNIQHQFITFTYHGKRVDVSHGGFNIESFLAFTGGQILYCNPIVFFIIARAIWHRDLFVKPAHKRILLLTGLPLIFIATSVSFFKELLPHWTGPAFTSLILLTACYVSRKRWEKRREKLWPVSFSAAAILLLVVITGGVLLINYWPGTLGEKKSGRTGYGDFTLDMYGWKKAGIAFADMYKRDHSNGVTTNTVILADEWFPAAHIDYYIAHPLGLQVMVPGPVESSHQYHWLNKQRKTITDSSDIYIISPSNIPVHKDNIVMLRGIEPAYIDSFVQNRGGQVARVFYIYYYRKGMYLYNEKNGF